MGFNSAFKGLRFK